MIRANVCYCVDQLSVVENRYHQVLYTLQQPPVREGRGEWEEREGGEGGREGEGVGGR